MTSSYKPTPLEDAYASYLLEEVFDIKKDSDAIRIPGRKAVPFLTTSGVERNILRNAWTVADPESAGKLKSKEQFCVVVRLVALAQAGVVTTETTDLLEALSEHTEEVPLPTFSSVEIPPDETLLEDYGAPMQLQEPQPILSVTDAFGDLIDVEDAPLPTLPAVPAEEPDVVEDDFGDFEEAEGEDADAESASPDAAIGNVVQDDFGEFEEAEGDDENVESSPPATVNEDDFDDFVEAPGDQDALATTEEKDVDDSLMDFDAPADTAMLPDVNTDSLALPSEGSQDRAMSEKSDMFYSADTELSKSADKDDLGSDGGDDFGEFADAEEVEDTDKKSEAAPGGTDEDVVPPTTDGQTGQESVTDQIEEPPPISPSSSKDGEAYGKDSEVLDAVQKDKEESQTMPLSVGDDDPFSAFDALADPPAPAPELPPLPPMPTAPVENVSSNLSPLELLATTVIDGQAGAEESHLDNFGDFEGAAAPVRDGSDTPVVQALDSAVDAENASVDDFGDFEAADESQIEPSVTNLKTDPEEVVVQPFSSSGPDDDGFRDYGETAADTFGTAVVPSNGDHGGEEKEVTTGNEDSFGDFEDANVELNQPQADVQPGGLDDKSDEDAFGDFGGFDTADKVHDAAEPVAEIDLFQSAPSETDGVTRRTGPDVNDGTEDDGFGDFGDFETAGNVPEAPLPKSESETSPAEALGKGGDDEGFGDFGDFEAVGDVTDAGTSALEDRELQKDSAETNTGDFNDGNNDTDFGDFGDFEAPAVTSGFSHFPPAEQLHTASGDLSENAEEKAEPKSQPKTSVDNESESPQSDSDDRFDQIVESDGVDKEFITPTENEPSDNFGDFAAFDSNPPSDGGDFGEKAAVETSTGEPADPFDADFGSFEFAAFDDEKEKSLEEMRKEIKTSPSQLRAAFNSINIVESFESSGAGGWLHLEERSKTDSESVKQDVDRARRSHHLYMLLTSTHKQHAQHWEQIITIARDEMATSILLLEEAKELSLSEQQQVSPSLEVMISGLAEYMRLVRLVVATLGDLLGLKPDCSLDEDNVSSKWHSLALAELAIEVETLWKQIVEHSRGLGIEDTNVDRLIELRTSCANNGYSEHLCAITLQPLSPDAWGTTKAEVTWDGRKLMACAANFFSHKVSSTVPC